MDPEIVDSVPGWERPLRIGPGVPLSQADPPYAIAAQPGRWRLGFRLGADVAAGAPLKLQLSSHRNNHGVFEPLQADRPDGPGHLSAESHDGRPLVLRPDGQGGTFSVGVPAGGLPAGQTVTVSLGDGARAPVVRMLNKFFLLYVPDGPDAPPPTTPAGGHQVVAACTMHVLGGPVHHLRAYVPSQTAPGETFSMLVRPEDGFSNLSCQFLEDLAVYADGEELDAGVEPDPDTTCVRIRLRLPDEGVYRLRVADRGRHLEATANPILCRRDRRAWATCWGMIHGHTEMSDGTGTLGYYFDQMRDEAGLDFAAPGDHDHLYETSDEMWERTCEIVARSNRPGEFVTFLGYEWAKWRRNGDGDRNVYYLHDYRPMYRSDEGHCPTPEEMFAAIADETAIVIPHHTAHAGNFCDFKDHDPLRERLIEIYQCRGSYECPAQAGNPICEQAEQPPVTEGFVSRALAMGWRVGFTGGGDDHTGHAGTDFPIPTAGGRVRYKAGLMSVLAAGRTREEIWEALWNRRTVATSGPRMLLEFRLDSRPMGSELDVLADPDLARRRRVEVTFHGTAPVERIDVIRNNQVVHTASTDGADAELTWEDAAPLHQVLLPPARFCPNPFCFYYVRVVQADGEAAWASPIWIDA